MDDNHFPINKRSNTRPSLLHFNGGGKDVLYQMEHGMWYAVAGAQAKTAAEVTDFMFPVGSEDKTQRFADFGCGDASQYPPDPHWKRHW